MANHPPFNPDIGINTRFTSTNQPEGRGRPRNVFNALRDQYEISSDDISTLITYCMSLTVEELETLSNDRTAPALTSAIANAVLNGINEGDMASVNTLIDRLFGRTKQVTESTVDLRSAPGISIEIISPNDTQNQSANGGNTSDSDETGNPSVGVPSVTE